MRELPERKGAVCLFRPLGRSALPIVCAPFRPSPGGLRRAQIDELHIKVAFDKGTLQIKAGGRNGRKGIENGRVIYRVSYKGRDQNARLL